MNKTQFTILVVFLTIIMTMVGGYVFGVFGEQPTQSIVPAPDPNPDGCSVCGRDRVSAHGGILLKNTTKREVEIRVRHHPDVSDLIVRLDPNGIEMIDDILVGTMKLRFIGDGFDEESFCTISPNTKHEMWWTVQGFDMRGTTMMHMGH